jgi:hypothetical protein
MTKLLDLTLVHTYDMGFRDAIRQLPRKVYNWDENQRIYDQGYNDVRDGNAFRTSFKIEST